MAYGPAIRRTHALVALSFAALAAVSAGACGSPDASENVDAVAPSTDLPAGYARVFRRVPLGAKPENDRGHVDPSRRIANLSLAFKLSPAQRADREALKAQLVDPTSPNFRAFLSPRQYAARFGAPAATLERAKSWLREQGLEVHEDSPLAARVTFSGRVDRLEAAFHTEVRRFEVNGAEHYAMTLPPAVPADIAANVAEVTNTHDFHPRPLFHRSPLPATTEGKTTGFAPPDWQNVYDVAKLYKTGLGAGPITGSDNGMGQPVKIVIVGVADISPGDVAAWRSAFDITEPGTFTSTIVPNTGADVGGTQGAGFEAVLDVEWSGANAPGAAVNLVHTGADDGNVDDATYYAVENNLGDVLNESFGGCEGFYVEAGIPASDQNIIDIYASAANILGITYLAASGDSGAALCEGEGGPAGLWVSLPAAYPGVTAVGGTQFIEGSLTGSPFSGYSTTEAVWDESDVAPNIGASGGGISVLFDRPSYQANVTTCTPVGSLPVAGIDPTKQRMVPDVAFTSASGGAKTIPDFAACTVDPNTQDCGITGSTPKFSAGGGTSFASPSFAGVVALMVQAAKGRLGNINPLIYNLAVTNPTVFNDVVNGTNEVTCTASDTGCGPNNTYGYVATKGYDCGTGFGSVDGYNIVAAVSGLTATTTSLQATPTTTSPGQNVMFTATVTAPKPNGSDLSGPVSFAFESTDQNSMLDLSWILGSSDLTGATTATGQATFSGPVPPGLVKPGMQSVNVYALYPGDATHLPSQSAGVTLTFGALSFAISPQSPTTAEGGKIAFTSTGGTPPLRWFTGADTTCDTTGENCSQIVETTGAFTAGPAAGTTEVSVLDANGIEATTTVTVKCVPATCSATNCGSIPDGCGGMTMCTGTCALPLTCGGGGTAYVCGCTPMPASSACSTTAVCGSASDGCGGMVVCGGACPAGMSCESNLCVTPPSTATSSSSSSGGAGGSEASGSSSSEASTSSGGSTTLVKSGCSCTVPGDDATDPRSLGAGLALLGALAARRRRAVRARRVGLS